MYSIKWRYHDQNNTKTDYYIVSNAIHIKKYVENNGPDWLAIAAAIVVIIILVIVVVVIVMFLMKREIVKLEAAVLFYRDGRVLSTHVPSDALPLATTPQTPAPPPVAAPPLGQYGPQQYQSPTAIPPVTAQAPAVATPPAKPMPTNEGTVQVQAVVQAAIDEIKQGTASKLPEKIILGHRKVLIELGQHTIIAVSLYGPEPATLRKGMRNSLQEIEIVYGNQLRNWDGLIHDMPRLQSIMEKEVKVRD